MDNENTNRIIQELRRQTRVGVWGNVIAGLVIIMLVAVPITYSLKLAESRDAEAPSPIWTRIQNAALEGDCSEQIKLLNQLLAKNPDDYYLHAYLGSIYVQKRQLDKAREHLEKSYALFPIEETEKQLSALRAVLENRAKPASASSSNPGPEPGAS